MSSVARSDRLRRRVRDFWIRYSWRQKIFVPVVIIGLGVARAMVLLSPLRFYGSALGIRVNDQDVPVPSPADAESVVGISRIIMGSARITPWDSNCLAQAIVAAGLLRLYRTPYKIHLGLRRDGASDSGELQAHAWTMAGDQPVTGFRESLGVTPVATYVWPAPSG